MSMEMSNRRSSQPSPKSPVAAARFGGRVAPMYELPIALNEGTWFLVEGNGTIERLPAANASAPIRLLFTGTVTLVHSTSLICQGYASLTVFPDDAVQCIPLGDGIWQVFVHRATAALPPFLSPPTGRLSLSSTAALPLTDITGSSAQTIYYIDCGAGYIPIWNIALGAWTWRYFTGSLSLALDSNSGHTLYHAADQVYDVYAFWDATLGSLRIGTTGQAGYTFSQRGSNITDVTLRNGIWVNAADSYLRINNTGNTAATDYIQPGVNQATYLGAIGTVAAGQGEDSVARRLVFNAYNPKVRNTIKKFTGSAYAYNTQAYRQVNADATMQVETLSGLPGVMHRAMAQHYNVVAAAPAASATSVGLNGTTAIAATEAFGLYGRGVDTTGAFGCSFDWEGLAPLGRNVWKWLEWGSGGTTTWQPNGDFLRNGIRVTVMET